MAKTVSYVNALTAGEIGPNARERTDLQQHARGCEEGFNLIGLVTGPLASRGGFEDRGAAAVGTARTRLVPFVRSAGDALFLELGESVARVWTTAGDRIMAAGVPYQFATPWTGVQAFRLFFKQEGDVVYVTDLDGRPTQVIKRLADDNWLIEAFDFREGPWLVENQDTALTLTATALTGMITLTSPADAFTADDIGSLVRIREGDGSPGLQTWTSKTDYTGAQKVQFDGKVYQRDGGGPTTSGTTPPVHSSGSLSDGVLSWTFLHDGAGVAKITAVGSPTSATATVVRALPTLGPTRYWARQAYSLREGYPRAVAEQREERLLFAASLSRPGSVDATRTAGFGPAYGDFKPGLGTGRVVEDDAVRLNVGGSSRVVWLLSTAVLLAGCTDGEYALSGSRLDDPITPDGRRAHPISAFGNADVAPVLAEGPPAAVLHVQRSRKILRETRVSPDLSVESRSLSVLAHHIDERGLAELAWQKSNNLLWKRLDDGGLAVMTYDMEQQVVGSTRQPLPEGFTVESIASAPSPDGSDVLMISVLRTKAGAPQRRIWRLSARADGIFMDGALRYAGAPATVISGLTYLDGETVAVVADGARVPDKVVTGGAITLPVAASAVQVGLKMTRRFKTLPLDMEGVGSTNGRTAIPTHATVMVDAVDALIGTDMPDSAKRITSRAPDDLSAPLVKRLKERVGLGNGSGRDVRLVIETDAPFDLVIAAWRLEAEVTK